VVTFANSKVEEDLLLFLFFPLQGFAHAGLTVAPIMHGTQDKLFDATWLRYFGEEMMEQQQAVPSPVAAGNY
jgi:hypothetical protein